MIEIDVRGLSCPIPVVRTKQAMDQNPKEDISVLLDFEVAVENVTRLAQSRGYKVVRTDTDDGYELSLRL